jgi:hypothetical protein
MPDCLLFIPAKPERFLPEVSQIPNLGERLSCLEFKTNGKERILNIQKWLSNFLNVCSVSAPRIIFLNPALFTVLDDQEAMTCFYFLLELSLRAHTRTLQCWKLIATQPVTKNFHNINPIPHILELR